MFPNIAIWLEEGMENYPFHYFNYIRIYIFKGQLSENGFQKAVGEVNGLKVKMTIITE